MWGVDSAPLSPARKDWGCARSGTRCTCDGAAPRSRTNCHKSCTGASSWAVAFWAAVPAARPSEGLSAGPAVALAAALAVASALAAQGAAADRPSLLPRSERGSAAPAR